MIAPFAVGLVSSVPQSLSWTEVALRFLSVLLLITINAFFVTAEFAIVSVRRSRINQLVDAGDVQARTVQNLQRSIDRVLSTTQLGITLSSLALGWIGESTMAVIVASWIAQLPFSPAVVQTLSHSLAIPLAFLLIAYLQIVLGELCPKAVAMLYAEEIARFLGPFSLAIARFFNPFIWVLNQSTRLLLRLIGIQYTGQEWYNQVTPEELQLIISTSSESTGLEAEEREILSNVFEFGDVPATDVMIQRPSMTTLWVDATVRDLLEEVAHSGHSRYPVIGDSLDDVCGMIHFKELAEPLVQGTLTLDSPIKSWIHPARFVPEYTPLGELLTLMQRSRMHMVVVVDEFGGTAGLVTIQDIISQIIGDSPEPQGDGELSIQILDENTFLIQAQTNLEEVNEELNLDFPLAEEYQTIGGFLFYQWQKIPGPGETLQYGNCELTVISAEGPRLHQIQVRRIEPSDGTRSRDQKPSNQIETSVRESRRRLDESL
ncbi:hemolysin family protein [Phormidesmis priestleyi]|uniref:hemolysin family protein n=1 Tax=Phormidesmis priestleyi TaxID=268141 RepID=UPI0009347807|nr:hemolysin family protein [Phormidesmis priestleyi]